MRNAIVFLTLILLSLNALAQQCSNTAGMNQGSGFIYWVGIGTGLDTTQYRLMERNGFLFDINIRPSAPISVPLPSPFESEFRFVCQCGFCRIVTLNDVIITQLYADPSYFPPGNSTTIKAEVTNNNPCTANFNLNIEVTDVGGNVVGSWSQGKTVGADSAQQFNYATNVLGIEGMYYIRATISSVSFSGTGQGCQDTATGNSKGAFFVVGRQVSFPIPEISVAIVLLIAFIVVVLLRRRK